LAYKAGLAITTLSDIVPSSFIRTLVFMPFSTFSFPDHLLKAIEALAYEAPTAIQEEVIPLVMSGKDLLVESQTGTGKTAAFGLPLVKLVADLLPQPYHKQAVLALVLVPTRELAIQVSDFLKEISRHSPEPVNVNEVIGGQDVDMQIGGLWKGGDIVVATPGRLLDLMSQKEIRLDRLKFLILDEADKLLTLGFQEDILEILKQLPVQRQNLLFSATLPPKVISLSKKILSDPEHIRSESENLTVENITQRVIEVPRDDRRSLLKKLIDEQKWSQVLVFVASKKAARNITAKLHRDGYSVDALHGDLTQDDRIAILEDFKRQEFSILISTDLASRGIDISELPCVVNYDLPRSPMDYVHRIGRTGRAGATGLAISFIDHEDQAHFRLIEKRTGVRLEREQIEGFELKGEPPERTKGPLPIKGKKKSKKDKLREQAQNDLEPDEVLNVDLNVDLSEESESSIV
jgi:ATP-dependent RNA helicase RhlE